MLMRTATCGPSSASDHTTESQSPGASYNDGAMSRTNGILKEIKNVFEIEIEALQSVMKSISSDFGRAVQTIAACRGRVIVTGIGKSGIIASKIAATLTSTGTPATYMHACLLYTSDA